MKPFFPLLLFSLFLGYTSCMINDHKSISSDTPDTSKSVADTAAQLVRQPQHPVQILLPTRYRKEAGYPENTDKADWHALYFDGETKQWAIENAALNISYGIDECVGDSILIIQNYKNALLFIRGIDDLVNKPVTILTDKLLLPDHHVSFDFAGKPYRLSCVGSYLDHDGSYLPSDTQRLKAEAALSDFVIENYQLYFSEAIGSTVLIATQGKIQSDGHTPKLIWAGDLNGDSLPDMIIDIADWYEAQQVLLLLSDRSDQEHFLKNVAELTVVNDC